MKFRHQTKSVGLLLLAAVLAACAPSRPADFAQANWMTDADKAIAAAKQQGKPLLIAFFGSDWSTASQTSQKDVLDTMAFKDYADANLVLLEVDFTRKGASSQLEKVYGELAKGLGVDHFPVFFLADPANNQGPFQRLNSVGNNGPLEFVNQITAVLAEYRSQLAAKIAQGQLPGPGSTGANVSPANLSRAAAAGFPNPQDLLNHAQSQPGVVLSRPSSNAPVSLPQVQAPQNLPAPVPSSFPAPENMLKPPAPSATAPNSAPPEGTDAPMIQLK